MERIVIWGTGGHAKAVAEAIRCAGLLQLVGFIDDVYPERRGNKFCDSQVIGGRESLPALLEQGITAMALGFGNNAARLKLSEEMSGLGFRFPIIIHPSAVIAKDCEIGAGSFIAALAVINPGSRIGEHVIVNTGAIIEHDCEIETGVHIGPRTCLTGGVRVGRNTWLGAGSVVRDKVTIGEGSIIGMGAVVIKSLPDRVMAYGCPAKIKIKI